MASGIVRRSTRTRPVRSRSVATPASRCAPTGAWRSSWCCSARASPEASASTGGIVATAAFFGSIVAHEFGHALVARRFGVETESIDLWLLGGVAQLDREPPTPRAEGLIAVAGPAGEPAHRRRGARRSGSRFNSVIARLDRRGQRRCSPCSTCSRAPRSTVVASCGPCAGLARATSTRRSATPATPAGCSAGAWPASEWR